jgi:hypothetical protein
MLSICDYTISGTDYRKQLHPFKLTTCHTNKQAITVRQDTDSK